MVNKSDLTVIFNYFVASIERVEFRALYEVATSKQPISLTRHDEDNISIIEMDNDAVSLDWSRFLILYNIIQLLPFDEVNV